MYTNDDSTDSHCIYIEIGSIISTPVELNASVAIGAS